MRKRLRNIFRRRIEKSEYDIVYGWYEEKRDECEMLRKLLEDLSHRPIELTLIMRKADG